LPKYTFYLLLVMLLIQLIKELIIAASISKGTAFAPAKTIVVNTTDITFGGFRRERHGKHFGKEIEQSRNEGTG
jgi:hypothetical protein